MSLTNATPQLASVVLTGTTLTFANWATHLAATSVTLQSGAKLTLPGAFTDAQMSNRVHIVCGDFTMAAGSLIDVSGCGYLGAVGVTAGQGPGKGRVTVSPYRFAGGAGHGGKGGDGSDGYGGVAYGSLEHPLFAGSGGAGEMAGAGGGAILIEASGAVAINGDINANGTSATKYGGGGSGGSILIYCATIAGSENALLSVNGGDGMKNTRGGGGGAGGRIAIHYDPVAQIAVGSVKLRFATGFGKQKYNDHLCKDGEPGTLWLPDTQLLSAAPGNFPDAVLYGPTSWEVTALALTNNVLRIGTTGFVMRAAGAIEIGAGAGIVLQGSSLLECDNLRLINGGWLTVYGGATNNLTAESGTLVEVAGLMEVGTGSWVKPYAGPTDNDFGTPLRITDLTAIAPHFRLGSLAIAAGGGFNADGLGYAGGFGNEENGYGPGPGVTTVSPYNYGGGGGHGGAGGTSARGAGGIAYDEPFAPMQAGSGGAGERSGAGGGVIRLEVAESITLGGTLTANGASGGFYGGGGAGGSIFAFCDQLLLGEAAKITASGGNAGNSGSVLGGGGGGGRVAFGIGLDNTARKFMQREATAPLGSAVFERYAGPREVVISSAKGRNLSSATRDGAAGTIRFVTSNLTLEVAGEPWEAGRPLPQGYGTQPYKDAVPLLVTNSVNLTDDEEAGSRWETLGWSLERVDGTSVAALAAPQADFELDDHLRLTWHWTNSHHLAVESAMIGHGYVNDGEINGWYTNGVTVAGIRATPMPGYKFALWLGDVPQENQNDNPLTVIMTEPRQLMASFVLVGGQRKAWQGSGAWEEFANWTPSGMPGEEDEVIINGGTVELSQAHEVASLVISNGATVIFSNWETSLTAGDVTLTEGAQVTLPAPFTDATMSNRVHFVCTNFTMHSGTTIDVSGKGYAGSVSTKPGNGPGKGLANIDPYRFAGGAGHGGPGGDGSDGYGGVVYGDLQHPLYPGSGGAGEQAGNGGGAVLIEALGSVVIDGHINANATSSTLYGGGGSGGSILIYAHTIGGTAGALLSANGGDGNVANRGGGGGAGGRIAIHYDPVAQAAADPVSLRFATAFGRKKYSDYLCKDGFPGTLWLPDVQLLSHNPGNFPDAALHGPTSWEVPLLALTNSILRFGTTGFVLRVSGDVDITANSGLVLPGGSLLECRNLKLTEGGWLDIRGGVTNKLTAAGGALVDVTSEMLVGSGSWVTLHPGPAVYTFGRPLMFTDLDTTPPLLRMGALFVAQNSGFKADGVGFAGGVSASEHGYGPGRGLVTVAPSYNYGGGGGHGGAGGDGERGAGGAAYGSSNAPVRAGSGGGGYQSGTGGGVIRLEVAGRAEINGSLMANATDAFKWGGGGAGGSIWLICGKFSGDGNACFEACGSKPGQMDRKSGGGGGGGRIAIWNGIPNEWRHAELLEGRIPSGVTVEEEFGSFAGTISAAYGVNPTYPERNGVAGTIVLLTIPPPGGTVLLLR